MGFKFFVEIIRPANCILAGAAVFIGQAVATRAIAFSEAIFFAMISAFLICAGGQVINDFFDIEIDKKIRPQKILPSKKMSANTALVYSATLFLAGIIFAAAINFHALAIAFIFTALLILYSAFIQKQKFFGNIIVALGTAFTLVFGASITQNYGTIVFLAASAFFANIAREIIKDVQDKKADEGYKKTIPMILPQKQVNALVLLLYILAFFIALAPVFLLQITNPVYTGMIIAAGMVFIYSFKLLAGKNPEKAQAYSKTGMALSLLGFLAGAF